MPACKPTLVPTCHAVTLGAKLPHVHTHRVSWNGALVGCTVGTHVRVDGEVKLDAPQSSHSTVKCPILTCIARVAEVGEPACAAPAAAAGTPQREDLVPPRVKACIWV